ncbi:FAS1-like dehydratase domain-containing protein [Chelativorans xinjiangense]|uniref:FAS1-like dehydratase domain-containing protein n=1 Tax=Chelativorans xinjiangense TaxID=2681485 RepID=UPI001359E905|nr:MaoC family dehydratase N-terminal domain-containing protein [Chelativorans xinjiangense]
MDGHDTAGLEIDVLRRWIGRSETAVDTISERLAASFQATFDFDPSPRGKPAPLAIHWCLAPAIAKAGETEVDGHPARGGFLPPVPLPRRMWAGGEIRFHDALLVGDEVTRTSRIADIAAKAGRTGPLCFVKVEHRLSTARGLAIVEHQDVVYRQAATGQAAVGGVPAAGDAEERPQPQWRESVVADTLLLFRYSALTFNGHRIHYDRDYATEAEGYPGLVIHGPLQATLLLHMAARLRDGAPPRLFRYRSLRPLFEGEPLFLNAMDVEGGLDLWTSDGPGARAMSATAA